MSTFIHDTVLLTMSHFTVPIIVLALLWLSASLAQDYPSCIGLDLATNFYFSGDVTSQESCAEACKALFPDATGNASYDDTSPLTNGTLVASCECGSYGKLCEDALPDGGSSTPAPTDAGVDVTSTTSAAPEPTVAPPTMTPASSASSSVETRSTLLYVVDTTLLLLTMLIPIAFE